MAELVSALRKASVALSAAAAAAQTQLGVGRTDVSAMEIMSISRRLTAGELAEQLRVGSGTAAGLLDRLASVGYAERRPDPHDRRRTLVSLTPKGRRRFRQAYVRRLNWLRRAAGEMSPEELSAVVRFLSGLSEVVPPGWRADAMPPEG